MYKDFIFELRFEDKPDFHIDKINEKLEEKIGACKQVSVKGADTGFAFEDIEVEYADGKAPAIMVLNLPVKMPEIVDQDLLDQMWDIPEGSGVLDDNPYAIVGQDFIDGGLDIKIKANLLMDYLEALLVTYPKCHYVYFPTIGLIMPAEIIRHFDGERDSRFANLAIKVRLWQVGPDDEFLMDTVGMGVLDMPDLQYHFHNLDPNDIITHAYMMADYIIDNYNPIEDGSETVSLVNGKIDATNRWTMSYSQAKAKPKKRPIIDFYMNEYSPKPKL